MSDLISRQAAIDALGEKPLAWTEGEYEFGLQNQWQSDVDALNGLPSAEPEIIRCKDCKWFGDIGCAIEIVDDSDRPSENDFCSYAERRTDVKANKGASR